MPNLAPHLHTDECNRLIRDLADCERENPYKRYMGACNVHYSRMQRCLKREREANRRENHKKAIEFKKKFRSREPV